MKKRIKKILKKFKIVRKVHQELIGQYLEEREIGVNVYEITPLKAKREVNDNKRYRLNILVPTLRKNMVFGGVSTALKFFNSLAEEGDFDRRIITTDSDVHKEDIDGFADAEIVDIRRNSDAQFQIVAANDRGFSELIVRENDIFIATTWWSAYILKDLLIWQNHEFCVKKDLIYLIQDYEPGFYPWSSRYLLADSTYRMNEISTIAVFNTKILYDYFKNNCYSFHHEYYFEPILNEHLVSHLKEAINTRRKKQLIVYGRPSVERNCFEIIVGSLRKLLESNEEARNWSFLSLGEAHKDIDLEYDCKLISKGKVSLDEYAIIMSESSVGLSLMNSPHPSYPPLEMSTFGVSVVTNTYANKDLSGFNNHIVSVTNCSYKSIAEELSNLINNSKEYQNIDVNEDYVYNVNLFDNISKELVKICKG